MMINLSNTSRYGLLAIIFLLLALCVCATSIDTSYNYTGQNDYMLSETSFNHLTGTNYDVYTKSVSSPIINPLVSDLNGDGMNEMIVLDGCTVRLYQNKTLSIVDGLTMPSSTYDDMIVYDIDGDGNPEVVISTANKGSTIHILKYNGTSFFENGLFNTTGTISTSKTMIACRQANDCIIVAGLPKSSSNTYDATYIVGFNSTNATSSYQSINSWALGSNYDSDLCFPSIKSIDVKDYDNDGTKEYIFTAYLSYNGIGDRMYIFYTNNTGTGIEKMTTSPSNIYKIYPIVCSRIGTFFTSPLVHDWDGYTSNGLETAVGYMTGSNTFKISVYDSAGGVSNTHPNIYTADGQIISNIMRACIFSDTNCNDYCVLGFSNASNRIDLLCGTSTTGEFYDSREFAWRTPSYNLSISSNINPSLSHSIQAVSDTLNSINPSEFSTSYGILEISTYQNFADQFAGYPGIVINGFQNPKQNSAVIMSDAEKTGRDDMLALTSTNIWYIDDRYSNSQATIGSVTINPTPASTWKQNTTVGITIEVNDVDGDSVRANAILYQGTSYAQESNWTVFSATGTTFSFSFKASEITSNSLLVLYADDIMHNSTNVTYTKTFSVALEGISFGEGLFTDNGTPSVNLDQACFGNTCVNTNNSILTSVNQFDTVFNLGIGKTAIWLIFMLIVGIMIWVSSHQNYPQQTFIFVAFAETIMVILGFFLTMFGWGVLITLIIVCLAVISMKIRSFLTGDNGGSGVS